MDGKNQLKIGLDMPIFETAPGNCLRWPAIRDIAVLCENVGFDSLWFEDHLLWQEEGESEPLGRWESWSVLSAVAASTRSISLGNLVVAMDIRNPALLAKMADTVDEISGGRLILGLGTGYHDFERRAFGYPIDHRYSRFEEAIQIVHGLLRDGEVDFHGTYHQAPECVLRPRGPTPGGPPILIGTTGPKMLRLTARYADMWNVYWLSTGNSPTAVPRLRQLVDEACDEVGRDKATLERTVTVLVADADAEPWWDELPTGPEGLPVKPLQGEPAEIAEALVSYQEVGISHVQITLDSPTTRAIEEFALVIESLRKLGS